MQEKRSLFLSVFVFLEKNLSKTKISRFWPESPGFLEKKINPPGFELSEVGRSEYIKSDFIIVGKI